MLRAVGTIQPFSAINNINIQLHDELQERTLSQIPLEDWKSELQKTLLDFEYKINGGESSKEALLRILNVVNQLDETKNHIIVSHGNLLCLLINYYDSSFGFGDSL
ncbi:histidine phosphatase family protein, partial [Mammaliicoccus sciuri]|uniref:histidine phosphatase family protein n=1 Tax=Mammaliicoccus sciuri TaxID=1296 RepID=UPI0034DD14EA